MRRMTVIAAIAATTAVLSVSACSDSGIPNPLGSPTTTAAAPTTSATPAPATTTDPTTAPTTTTTAPTTTTTTPVPATDDPATCSPRVHLDLADGVIPTVKHKDGYLFTGTITCLKNGDVVLMLDLAGNNKYYLTDPRPLTSNGRFTRRDAPMGNGSAEKVTVVFVIVNQATADKMIHQAPDASGDVSFPRPLQGVKNRTERVVNVLPDAA